MIKGVIFDWAGTTIDYGSQAPVTAFRKAFAAADIVLTNSEIRQDMGIAKRDHIHKIFNQLEVQRNWQKRYGHLPLESDEFSVYQDFQELLAKSITEFTAFKPGLRSCLKYLRESEIQVGTTTGYTRETIEQILPHVAKHGYVPDAIVCPEDVNGHGRPAPDMIERNMALLKLSDPKTLIKVGDTIMDVAEGQAAGVTTVAVIEGSSLMGLSKIEFESSSEHQKESLRQNLREQFNAAGANYVINNLYELPMLIDVLDKQEVLTN
ncbi:phosphonoacetaldehyde hydrolase [Lactobacillus sp. CC-MHH1034]|uniref:phosphonoacetaldehyde hydrolase n=1 Tax=Agrilactobacillus fermenti TaxID=2586909 RepID=UPI001E38623D|nr:phosphonoacetaldehyde hydrolase [Agrilactobacillus fermenti]MCD2257286.1 phosphonoacetaldehyde hydrolase [Agrilactobacillus fermenti]